MVTRSVSFTWVSEHSSDKYIELLCHRKTDWNISESNQV